jgi:hypothetical protein
MDSNKGISSQRGKNYSQKSQTQSDPFRRRRSPLGQDQSPTQQRTLLSFGFITKNASSSAEGSGDVRKEGLLAVTEQIENETIFEQNNTLNSQTQNDTSTFNNHDFAPFVSTDLTNPSTLPPTLPTETLPYHTDLFNSQNPAHIHNNTPSGTNFLQSEAYPPTETVNFFKTRTPSTATTHVPTLTTTSNTSNMVPLHFNASFVDNIINVFSNTSQSNNNSSFISSQNQPLHFSPAFLPAQAQFNTVSDIVSMTPPIVHKPTPNSPNTSPLQFGFTSLPNSPSFNPFSQSPLKQTFNGQYDHGGMKQLPLQVSLGSISTRGVSSTTTTQAPSPSTDDRLIQQNINQIDSNNMLIDTGFEMF